MLTEKNSKFVWSDQKQTAFDTLKQLLTTAPVLSYTLLQDQPFLLDCDAFNVSVGAVLSQVQDGERVISYFSKCLSRAERQNGTTKKWVVSHSNGGETFPSLSGWTRFHNQNGSWVTQVAHAV